MEVKNYFATDASGNILGSAQVYVYLAGTTSLATGLQNISGASLSNPFTSQANGLVQFQAPDNDYDMRVVKLGRDFTIRIQCFDGVAFLSEYESSIDAISGRIDLPNAKSLRIYGAKMDGTTDDYSSLKAATDQGVIPIFDGPSKIVCPSGPAAAEMLLSINRWQVLDKVSLVLPADNAIEPSKLMDLNNPTLGNLTLSGSFVNGGSVTAIASVSGSAKAWVFDITLSSVSGIAVGDYLLLKPTAITGWALCDAFVTGSWRITAISGNRLRVSVANAHPTLPASLVTSGILGASIVKTVVRFPRNSAGVRINGQVIGAMTNIVFAGRFDIANEAAFDGPGDGLQVGGAADKYSTGLNESEQVHSGATWCQRVVFNEFEGNGIQVLHGSLYGSLIFACANAWRGEQSASGGEALVKGIVCAGNGASGGQVEKAGNADFADAWLIGNQQQGLLAIGLSVIDGLRAICLYNQFAQVDARNGGQLILDSATISGTAAMLCNGGRILVGESATVEGSVTINETGTVIAKGATSITGTLSVENGSLYQLPDGSIFSQAINRLLANDNWQYRTVLSSIGDVSYQHAPAGSGTWSTDFTVKATGEMYPGTNGTANLGRFANRYNLISAVNVALSPPASVTPANNGEMSFQLTSNTSLTIKVRGSDGVVRSGSITLA